MNDPWMERLSEYLDDELTPTESGGDRVPPAKPAATARLY